MGAINTIDQVVKHPQVQARGMIVESEHPVAGKVKRVGVPVKLSETPGSVREPAPLLGQHTDEVLHEYLGMTDAEIAALRQEGVIGKRGKQAPKEIWASRSRERSVPKKKTKSEGGTMIGVLTHHWAKADKVSEARKLLDRNGEAQSKAPGFVSRQTLLSRSDPTKITTLVVWTTNDIYDAWRASPERAVAMSGAEALWAKPPESERFDMVG